MTRRRPSPRPRGRPRRERTEAELAVLRDPAIGSTKAGRLLGLSPQRVRVLRRHLVVPAPRRYASMAVYAEDCREIDRRAAESSVEPAAVVAALLAVPDSR